MEQNNTVGRSDDSNTSPPPGKAKYVKDGIPQEFNHQKLETTSNDAVLLDEHLIDLELLSKQQSTNTEDSAKQ